MTERQRLRELKTIQYNSATCLNNKYAINLKFHTT